MKKNIMVTQFIFSMVMAVTIAGCTHHHHKHSEKHSHHSDKHHSDKHHSGKHHHATLDSLGLNNGQKWEMDTHTRTSLQTMNKRFDGIELSAMSDEQRQELANQLNEDLQSLIQGCTMEGAAHDALHQYLVPLMNAINHLADCGHLPAAKHVETLLAQYADYFQ
ncbi:MAG: hypothetical protein MI867_28250 [Pseudomonadales bacterium]|nr:hypothetical protein [Pseudomonadales bacterium]